MTNIAASEASTIVMPWWFAISALLVSAGASMAGATIAQRIAARSALEREREAAERERENARQELFRSDKLVLLAQILAAVDEQDAKFKDFLEGFRSARLGRKGIDDFIMKDRFLQVMSMGNLLVPSMAPTLNNLDEAQRGVALGFKDGERLNQSVINDSFKNYRQARNQFVREARIALGVEEKPEPQGT